MPGYAQGSIEMDTRGKTQIQKSHPLFIGISGDLESRLPDAFAATAGTTTRSGQPCSVVKHVSAYQAAAGYRDQFSLLGGEGASDMGEVVVDLSFTDSEDLGQVSSTAGLL